MQTELFCIGARPQLKNITKCGKNILRGASLLLFFIAGLCWSDMIGKEHNDSYKRKNVGEITCNFHIFCSAISEVSF